MPTTTPSSPSLRHARSVPTGADLIVVGRRSGAVVGVDSAVTKAFSRAMRRGVDEVAASLGSGDDLGATTWLPAVGDVPVILVVGLGDSAAPGVSTEDLRSAAGSAARAIASHAGKRGHDSPLTVAVSLNLGSGAELRAVSEGLLLGSYSYRPTAASAPTFTVISTLAKGATAEVDAARAVADAVLTAREWINLPPNLLYPESFAADVTALVAGSKVDVEVLDEKALAKGGYGGILGVGAGSTRPPRLVRLSYAPRGATAHLALVGKGITFDSGGLNLKPGEGMYTMKCDMSGAAAVLAAVKAVADLGLKVKVTAYGALAENLPSGSAFRPSDVLTMYGGTTVENGNSDAEGRLVMADAIVRAGQDKPDLIVDIATLTGACVTALGDRIAGLMSTDQQTTDTVLAAANDAGEAFWPLPLPPELRPKLESKVADLKSTGPDRGAGASIAGTFLKAFVPEGTPWAHLDIAGTAFHTGAPYGYVVNGGTGFGVRTLIALARSMQA